MRKDAIPCSLHTWKATLYLLDEPWDEAVSVAGTAEDYICLQLPGGSAERARTSGGQQISEVISGKLREIARKLRGKWDVSFDTGGNQPCEAESPIDPPALNSSSNPGTEEDKVQFLASLQACLQEEQQTRVSSALTLVLTSLFRHVTVCIKASGPQIQYRKRLYSLFMAINAVAALRERLLKGRLLAGFAGVKHYGDMQALADVTREQEAKYARVSREEACKQLQRVLARCMSTRNTATQAQFLRKITHRLNYYRKVAVSLSRVCAILTGDWVKAERGAVKQWREMVILQGMRKWGAGKLVKTLSRATSRLGWTLLTGWNQRKSQLISTFAKLLRRRNREKRRAAVGKFFSVWKHVAYQLSLGIQSRLQAGQVSFKALSNVLRRVLRKVYFPTFTQIQTYAIDSHRATTLRHPLLFFSSIYEKIHTRTYSWAFNTLIRFNPESLRQRRKQCVKALARIGASVTRKALWEVMDLAASIQQQLTIDFALILLKVVDRARLRSLGSGVEGLVRYDEGSARFPGRYLAQLQLEELAESVEILTSRTNGYYSPEETASFLTKDPSRSAFPNSKSTTPTRLQKPKTAHKSMGSAGVSPTNSSIKPPWRAPSRSGTSKLPTKDAQIRRKEYDAALKQRQAKYYFRAESPPPVPKLKGLIDLAKRPDRSVSQCERNLSSASTERRYYPMERNLSVVVGVRSLLKAQVSTLWEGWQALKRWVVQGDGFQATLGGGDYISAYREEEDRTTYEALADLPDDQELESSWKTRLAKVGLQRISKLLDRHTVSLQAAALAHLRTIDPS